MGDVPQRLAQQGVGGGGTFVPLEPGVPDQRTDPDPPVVDRHGVEAVDEVDVDEVGWRGQAHVEHGDEALPAREDLAVVADLTEHRDRLVDGAGSVVHERSGLHASIMSTVVSER